MLYTSQPDADAQGTVDAFKAAHPEVEVEWTRNGTGQLMNVLQAEFAAGDPRPDVLLVADTINIGQLKRDGRLMAYEEAATAGYNPELFDADGAPRAELLELTIILLIAVEIVNTFWGSH